MQADGGNRADLLPVEKGIWGPEDGSGQAVEGVGEGECGVEEAGGGPVAGQPDPEGSVLGKILGPAKRRRAVAWVRERLGPERVSQRRACRVLGQPRSTQRRVRQIPEDGRAFRLLTILDEYTRECLAIDVARRMNHRDVLDRLAELFIERGVPESLRSDNGPEFTAQAIRDWLKVIGVRTLYIEPGSPWENGYVENFNGKLRDELLNREVFETLREAPVLIERWRREYNQRRLHSALRYRPPAPEAFLPRAQAGNSSSWAGLQIIPALT